MKREVKNFSVQVVGTDVIVEVETDRLKPYKYRIWADERHKDIFLIEKHLSDGFFMAKTTRSKIEIRDYAERSYVFFTLPNSIGPNQYSAEILP